MIGVACGLDNRSCRIEDVVPRHTYAWPWMSLTITAMVSSASSLTYRRAADYALCAFVEFAAAEQHRTASYGAAWRAGRC